MTAKNLHISLIFWGSWLKCLKHSPHSDDTMCFQWLSDQSFQQFVVEKSFFFRQDVFVFVIGSESPVSPEMLQLPPEFVKSNFCVTLPLPHLSPTYDSTLYNWHKVRKSVYHKCKSSFSLPQTENMFRGITDPGSTWVRDVSYLVIWIFSHLNVMQIWPGGGAPTLLVTNLATRWRQRLPFWYHQ